MAIKKPSMWLEGLISLFVSAIAIAFFYYFIDKWPVFSQDNFAWVKHLHFPIVAGTLGMAFYFFFPNQSWKMPLIIVVSYLMLMTGTPPQDKLNFGLDLAGGTEMLIRIAKNPEEIKLEKLTVRLKDLDKAIRVANGDEKAQNEVNALVEKLRGTFKDLTKQIAQLAGKEAVKAKRRKLEAQRDAVQQRINDLTGKNKDIEDVKTEINDLQTSKTKVNLNQVLDILRKRIINTSLSEIKVAAAGEKAILIQIPGLDQGRVDIIKNVIERQGILEFRLVKAGEAKEDKELPGYEIMTSKDSGKLLYVEKKAYVTGADVSAAYPTTGLDGWQVNLSFTGSGRRKFAALTSEHVDERLAIVLDGELMLAPNIKTAITDGKAVVTGGFDHAKASEIATVVQAGSLPVKLTIDSENKVGAALGEDSIRSGRMSLIIGFLMVVAIMLVYYLMAGVLAVIALFLNGLLIIGLLGLFNATLTLPGIAGIVLTLGMAVDANVLIFERIREEKASGKALKIAIKNGYERAFVTILDANITTIFTAIILYSVGTELIKSFAVTLIIGLLASMFTAIFVTRRVIEILYDAEWLKTLKMLQLFKTPKIDFLKMRFIAVILSAILIVIGLSAFTLTAKFGIDFKGGQMIQTVKPVMMKQIRDIVGKSSVSEPVVQSFGERTLDEEGSTQFVITYALAESTENAGGKEAETDPNAVREKFKKYLRENIPELALEPFPVMKPIPQDEVREMNLKGLKEEDVIISDFYRMEINLLAESTPDDVKNAINVTDFNERLDAAGKLQAFNCETIENNNTRFSLILRTAQLKLFDKEEDAELELKQEISTRLSDKGIALSDPFPRERLVGSSLSSDLQSKAIWAIILSSIVLLLYITFRFTFSFGVGAVVALFHDLFMTLGIIALLRVNITLDVLAAILTVIGYSLNDTIVVFDRIRENMKKLKKRDFSEVLNISINQVIARTVLTSVTTAVVILAVIFFGGDVLYGFAVTLLVGIITGTYSSVFIATPVVAAYASYRRKRELAAAKSSTDE